MRSKTLLKILLVSADREDEIAMRDSLTRAGFPSVIHRVETLDEVERALNAESWSLVIIDHLTENRASTIALLEERQIETPHLELYESIEDVSPLEILGSVKMDLFVTRTKMDSIGKVVVEEIANAGQRMKKRVELEREVEGLLKAFGASLELRDHETQGHTARVTGMCLRFARILKVPKVMLINIYQGSLAHDLGKLGIPDSILLKKGKLTEEEWVIMRTHPQLALDLLSPIATMKGALNIPYCHHEKYDGTGYPRGLKDMAIPFEARIFSIVDVYDALTSDRPYRKAWTKEAALEHIMNERGKSFDPAIVLQFCAMMV